MAADEMIPVNPGDTIMIGKLEERRPRAVDGGVVLELCCYVGPTLFAKGTQRVSMLANWSFSMTLEPQRSAMRDWVKVDLVPSNSIGPWQWAEVSLAINGELFGSRKPLVFWSGEPTDWASGLVRWEWASPDEGEPDFFAALTVRRVQ